MFEYQNSFSKPGALPEWVELNGFTSGDFIAENGAGVLVKGAGSPPCRKLSIAPDTMENCLLEVTPSNFGRLNLFVNCTDYSNYIMVHTSGNGAYCAMKRSGTWYTIGNSESFPVVNGDKIAVEVKHFHPYILVSFILNGERKYTWAINEADVVTAGAVALQAENQDQTHLDSVAVTELS